MPDLKESTTCKHLTFEERIEIQDCLFHGVSFKGIAKRIGKDPTTVSKEVKKHIQVIPARTENPRPCPDLLKAPFICNGCQRKRNCKLENMNTWPSSLIRLTGKRSSRAVPESRCPRSPFTKMTAS